MKCPKCGSDNIIPSRNGPHVSGYCGDCDSFVKHLSKQDLRYMDIMSHCPKCGEWIALCECKGE